MAELIPPSLAQYLPLWVRAELARLPAEQQDEFVFEYSRQIKSLGMAYLCWLLAGSHYLYLGRKGLQILMWATLGGLVVWWFLDAFRLPKLVWQYNADLGVNLVRALRILSR